VPGVPSHWPFPSLASIPEAIHQDIQPIPFRIVPGMKPGLLSILINSDKDMQFAIVPINGIVPLSTLTID
jgi:hypothetical protein